MAIWIFTISLIVRFPVNTRLIYAAAFAIPYALAWFRRRDLSWPTFEKPSDRRRDAAAFAVLLFVLLMQWLVALKPEISSDGLGNASRDSHGGGA